MYVGQLVCRFATQAARCSALAYQAQRAMLSCHSYAAQTSDSGSSVGRKASAAYSDIPRKPRGVSGS